MTINTNAKLRDAIRQLVDYNWEEEKNDYKRHLGEPSHIFHVIQALDIWESAK